MPLTIDSSRFGALEIPDADAIEFPLGLIGLGGLRYALIDRNPGSGFQWLHSLEDPGLALPVVDPREFFAGFALVLSDEDRERIGAPDLSAAQVYVTVRTAPDPARHARESPRPDRRVGGPRPPGAQHRARRRAAGAAVRRGAAERAG